MYPLLHPAEVWSLRLLRLLFGVKIGLEHSGARPAWHAPDYPWDRCPLGEERRQAVPNVEQPEPGGQVVSVTVALAAAGRIWSVLVMEPSRGCVSLLRSAAKTVCLRHSSVTAASALVISTRPREAIDFGATIIPSTKPRSILITPSLKLRSDQAAKIL